MNRLTFSLNNNAPQTPSPDNRVSIVTVCKGRLHHIQQTLPLMVAQSADEVIVVDYDCPQGVGDWVEENFNSVKVIRVHDDQGFCVARGRNAGAQNSSSPWICFVDADIKMASGFVEWMRQNTFSSFFYRCGPTNGKRDFETYGTFVCHRRAFESVKGYDELFRGWGGEDDDLYDRLKLFNVGEAYYPSDFVSAIPHDDLERVTFYSEKSKKNHHIYNHFYREIKLQTMAFYSEKCELPIEVRQQIDAVIRQSISEWDGVSSKSFPNIEFTIQGSSLLPHPYQMLREASFKFTLDNRT